MLKDCKEKEILKRLNAAGYEAYFVGGCVRDEIMGREAHDIDITTSATPEEVKEIFSSVLEVGIKHGTVVVMPYNVEVTTFRKDGEYEDNRHPSQVEFVTSLYEDLKRRDFTMNAIAMDVNDKLYDPFNGKMDIDNKIIRAVGNADDRFNEDSLRILRAIRFSSILGFEIDKETRSAIMRNYHLLENISKERIFVELKKMLVGKNIGNLLREYYEIIDIFIPGFKEMKDFNQNNPWHKYDLLEHTINSVYNIEPNINLRLTMLLHDIGKTKTKTTDENGISHFYNHQLVSFDIATNVLNNLKVDNKLKDEVLTLIRLHDIKINENKKSIKKFLSKYGENIFFNLLKVKEADEKAQSKLSTNFEEIKRIAYEIINENECLHIKDLEINGRDLLELGFVGTEIGEILNICLNLVLEDKMPNNHEILFNFSKTIAKKNEKMNNMGINDEKKR